MASGVRVAIAILVGLVAGGAVNMGIVTISPMLVAPPAGADLTTAEGLTATMHLLEPRHFVAPFLAHSLGTLAGALVAALIAVSHQTVVAYTVGAPFLSGEIAASVMIPAPVWFIGLDLVLAYLPMAWVGLRVATRLTGTLTA